MFGGNDERVFLGLPELGMGLVSLLVGLFIGSWFFFSAYGFPGSGESSKKGPEALSPKGRVAKTGFNKSREGREPCLKAQGKGSEVRPEGEWNNTGDGGHKMKQAASETGRNNEEKRRFAERSIVAEAFGDDSGLGLRLNLNRVHCEP